MRIERYKEKIEYIVEAFDNCLLDQSAYRDKRDVL
jgi:hypothetical protein